MSGGGSLVGEPLSQARGHVGFGLRQHQLGDGVRVVLEIETGARPELERPAGRRGEQVAAHLGQPGALRTGHQPVVDAGEDRVIAHARIIVVCPAGLHGRRERERKGLNRT